MGPGSSPPRQPLRCRTRRRGTLTSSGDLRHQSPGAGPVAGTMDQVRPLRREQLARRLRVPRLAGRSSSDPIRWQPRADPGQKQDTGGRIMLKRGIDTGGPVTEARLIHVHNRDSLAKLAKALIALETYVSSLGNLIIDYASARLDDEPFSTSPTESMVQWLLHRRTGARQQMRWSPRGAHLMLQVRTAIANGTFEADHGSMSRHRCSPRMAA